MLLSFRGLDVLLRFITIILYYAIISFAAYMIGQTIWWMTLPKNDTDFIASTVITPNSANAVARYAPFGQVKLELKKPEAAKIYLSGSYIAGTASFAILKVNGTNQVVKVGDDILEYHVAAITAQFVRLSKPNSEDLDIQLSDTQSSDEDTDDDDEQQPARRQNNIRYYSGSN